MTSSSGFGARRPVGPSLALVAAGLAAIPLVLARLDGDSDLDPFFVILVVASLTIAGLVAGTGLADRRRRWLARGIVLAWFAAALWAAFLLAIYQTACGCSMVAPPAPPSTGLSAADLATISHVVATYGGGVLAAVAAFGRPPAGADLAGPATRVG